MDPSAYCPCPICGKLCESQNKATINAFLRPNGHICHSSPDICTRPKPLLCRFCCRAFCRRFHPKDTLYACRFCLIWYYPDIAANSKEYQLAEEVKERPSESALALLPATYKGPVLPFNAAAPLYNGAAPPIYSAAPLFNPSEPPTLPQAQSVSLARASGPPSVVTSGHLTISNDRFRTTSSQQSNLENTFIIEQPVSWLPPPQGDNDSNNFQTSMFSSADISTTDDDADPRASVSVDSVITEPYCESEQEFNGNRVWRRPSARFIKTPFGFRPTPIETPTSYASPDVREDDFSRGTANFNTDRFQDDQGHFNRRNGGRHRGSPDGPNSFHRGRGRPHFN